MIAASLLVAGVTFRRLVTLRNLALAAAGGLLAGLLALGVPSASLAHDVLNVLVATIAVLVIFPLVAGLPTSDRLGGYEGLQVVRPIRSVALAFGRVEGSLIAGLLLLLIIAHVAHGVAGLRMVPNQLVGKSEASSGSGELWRFSVPAGSQGPYRLLVNTHLPFAGAGELEVTTRRSSGEHQQQVTILPVRRHEVVIPDLAPHRGDLYVSLTPLGGVVFGVQPPALEVGERPLNLGVPAVPGGTLARLAFALLVVLAAAHAFHFETACLSGVFALAVTPPQSPALWALSFALLLAFASLGTALVRRQALP
ncbi:MAG: hypothetical protein P8N09_02595 [Planctomycetota bacterium]|nr:hypothetical protein [Planctomycetota bacterium]